MKLPFLCIFFFLSFSSKYSPCKSERCDPRDKKVLLKIKQHFNNPYDLSSWDTRTGCCSWYGVECHYKTSRVVSLQLTTVDISGQIPDAVGDLPYLEYLSFHKSPNLTGTIPHTITNLDRLKSLSVTWANLSGPIPTFLGELKNLEDLDLSFNNFSGSIPESIAQLRKLSALRLDRNKLTGSIPESFGNLTPSLTYLFLSHNQLSGVLPRGWGNLNFSFIELNRNRLEGDISLLLGKNKTLQIADLSRNLFQFDFSNMELPDNLGVLDLNHNKITGSLPEGLVKLDLSRFNVSYNRLCGKIPVGGRLQELDYSNYFHNRCLCGAPLPKCK